jgi:hypothetical protein
MPPTTAATIKLGMEDMKSKRNKKAKQTANHHHHLREEEEEEEEVRMKSKELTSSSTNVRRRTPVRLSVQFLTQVSRMLSVFHRSTIVGLHVLTTHYPRC